MVNVLLLGGHGKIALRMTKLLTSARYNVTSVIRDPSHINDINAASAAPEYINPLVASIEDSTPESIAKQLEGVDWVIWSAGAGGKGGPERTRTVDEHAAKRYISASILAPSVSKFLMISASCCRQEPASWWNEEDIATFHAAWKAMPVYCQAKCVADEFLWDESRRLEAAGGKKVGWEDIDLRPGYLSDEPGTGRVGLGKARIKGSVTRDDVAAVAVKLLEKGGAGGLWVDLIGGEEDIETAVERVIRERINARE
ncbi:hypothetical protein RUND412_010317 [Rhizina undulata]